MGADGPTDECKRPTQRQNIICHTCYTSKLFTLTVRFAAWLDSPEWAGRHETVRWNRSRLSPNISLTHLLSCRCEDTQDPVITSLSPCSTTLPSMSAVPLEANHQNPFLTAEPWIRKEGISLICLRLVWWHYCRSFLFPLYALDSQWSDSPAAPGKVNNSRKKLTPAQTCYLEINYLE